MLTPLSVSCDPVRVVRPCASNLVRLVCVMLCVQPCASRLCYAVRLVSCVYLLRLSPAFISCVSSVLLCAVHSSPLHSFKHVKRVNSFKRLLRLSRASCSSCLSLLILPPEQFKHSIHSKRSTHITP